MKDILDTLQTLQNTPIPNILVISGVIFLFLAFVGKVGGFIEIPEKKQKWSATIGILLLTLGSVIFIAAKKNESDNSGENNTKSNIALSQKLSESDLKDIFNSDNLIKKTNKIEQEIDTQTLSSEKLGELGIDKNIIIKANSGDMIDESNLAWQLWKIEYYSEAIKWDYKAAIQGGRTSQKRMGLYYQRGFGVKVDYKKAAYWHEKAAERGDDYSAYNLAKIYSIGGFGVEKDLNNAYKWILKAVELISPTEVSQEYQEDVNALKLKIEEELHKKKYSDALSKNSLNNWVIGGSSSNSYEIGVDNNSFYSVAPSFYIKSTSENIKNDVNGTLTQRLKPDKYKGKRIKISAYVKSEYPEKIGNTSYFYISGHSDEDAVKTIYNTKDWQQLAFVVDIPETAKYFDYGVSLWGTGQIWIDDLKIKIVDKSVPLDFEPRIKELIEPENLP